MELKGLERIEAMCMYIGGIRIPRIGWAKVDIDQCYMLYGFYGRPDRLDGPAVIRCRGNIGARYE